MSLKLPRLSLALLFSASLLCSVLHLIAISGLVRWPSISLAAATAVIWLTLLLLAVWRFKARGAWLLIGLPPFLLAPLLSAELDQGCFAEDQYGRRVAIENCH